MDFKVDFLIKDLDIIDAIALIHYYNNSIKDKKISAFHPIQKAINKLKIDCKTKIGLDAYNNLYAISKHSLNTKL